ncbi:mechanosensitive ion channel family protein, partial [Sulfuricaulis sp.]|uniref:mechanosensitive ion channel family protein n=1 Tax=Sulfuricaulis sp. TaxID=2003553 RepID=UPI003C795437
MEQVNLALEPLRAFLMQLGVFLPKLILAIIIIIAGWLLAKFLKLLVIKGLQVV